MVDGGSEDGTWAIVEQIVSSNRRIGRPSSPSGEAKLNGLEAQGPAAQCPHNPRLCRAAPFKLADVVRQLGELGFGGPKHRGVSRKSRLSDERPESCKFPSQLRELLVQLDCRRLDCHVHIPVDTHNNKTPPPLIA